MQMSQLPDPSDFRTTDYDIEPIFPRRWSPRAMSGESLTREETLRLFAAARWAPSTYNEQEWRFLYALRDGQHWDRFFGLLVEQNQAWCKAAALLGCVVSHRVFERNGKPNRVHTFDAGLAYMSLALQGSAMGLVVHGMMGFDFDRARETLAVPEDYSVDAMFAVGRPGDPQELPEKLREQETPSDRKPVDAIICEGPFAF
jgi:nitroreductase